MTERLFVYGSLRPGGENAHMLDGLDGDWQPATVRGVLLDKGWGAKVGYPGLVVDDSAPPVRGFLFSSRGLGARWAALDDFEGEDYERREVTVTLDNGVKRRACVYAARDGRP